MAHPGYFGRLVHAALLGQFCSDITGSTLVEYVTPSHPGESSAVPRRPSGILGQLVSAAAGEAPSFERQVHQVVLVKVAPSQTGKLYATGQSYANSH